MDLLERALECPATALAEEKSALAIRRYCGATKRLCVAALCASACLPARSEIVVTDVSGASKAHRQSGAAHHGIVFRRRGG